MQPRLLGIAGPLKDSVIPLSDGSVTLGRDASNAVAVTDPSVSRKHCVVRREEDGRFRVRDLESRNGTVVNGLAGKEHWLHHGDEITIGDSAFLFLTEDDNALASQIEFDEQHLNAETKLIHPKEVLYLQPERVLKQLPGNSSVARNLNALLQISRAVHAIRDLSELQGKLLELIFEIVPASRGAILLSERDGQFTSTYARMRHPAQGQSVQVSRTIAKQVMKDGVAILGIDVPGSGELRNVESLAASQVRSLLCVPLTLFQRVIGCIYLDSTNPARRFDEEHLQIVAAVAGISAVALDNARRLQWLEEENQRLTAEVGEDHDLIGDSPRMKEIYQFLKRVAPADSTVLIEGESGTGKELAARALHRNSPRSTQPFIAINCAAIPENLLETELFGHERGAFTGAAAQKKGKIEIANDGVVFLDEVGELASSLQVKLLRVLQEREFERVGGTRSIKVDIRVIAATNRNLDEAVASGKFRRDLYYRLAVVRVTMPPLRDRKEDVPTLTRHFVQKYAKRSGVKVRPVSPEAMAVLCKYDWPGNVRELENAIERALVLGFSETVLAEDLPEALLEHAASASDIGRGKYHAEVKEQKKQLILNAVEQSRGNLVEAAEILGLHPNYLHRLIRNLELREILDQRREHTRFSKNAIKKPVSG